MCTGGRGPQSVLGSSRLIAPSVSLEQRLYQQQCCTGANHELGRGTLQCVCAHVVCISTPAYPLNTCAQHMPNTATGRVETFHLC